MQETLEDILYEYVVSFGNFGLSKPNNRDFKYKWNEGSTTNKLEPWTNAEIWAAALDLEKDCLVSIDRKWSRNIAEVAPLTPVQIIKAKLDKRKKSVTM